MGAFSSERCISLIFFLPAISYKKYPTRVKKPQHARVKNNRQKKLARYFSSASGGFFLGEVYFLQAVAYCTRPAPLRFPPRLDSQANPPAKFPPTKPLGDHWFVFGRFLSYTKIFANSCYDYFCCFLGSPRKRFALVSGYPFFLIEHSCYDYLGVIGQYCPFLPPGGKRRDILIIVGIYPFTVTFCRIEITMVNLYYSLFADGNKKIESL